MIDKDFVLSGKAIFTVEIPAAFLALQATHPDKPQPKPHYTYRVSWLKPNDRFPVGSFLVSWLNGPDNTHDYMPFGKLNKDTGVVTLTRSSPYAEESWPVWVVQKTLVAVWEGRAEQIVAGGWDVHHEGRCCCCGRRLTHPESCEDGIGPECRKRHAA